VAFLNIKLKLEAEKPSIGVWNLFALLAVDFIWKLHFDGLIILLHGVKIDNVCLPPILLL
jgi:hypothetical protein